MFTRLLTDTMLVKRLKTSTGIKRTYAQKGPYKCLIQPNSAMKSEYLNSAMGRSFTVYADLTADVQESDEITIRGTKYKVSGVSTRRYGMHPHKEIIVDTESNPQ